MAVARALITDPARVLADEPTGALDHDTRDEVADLLFGLVQGGDRSLLIATHDPDVAARADRILASRGGRVETIDVVSRR
ncbi:MAG: hypothetical protein V9G19_17665 [Tetrasphaera sp.]